MYGVTEYLLLTASFSSISVGAVPAERPAVGWQRKTYLPGFDVRCLTDRHAPSTTRTQYIDLG